MMKNKENFDNFIAEAHPIMMELARISRKHMLVGENVVVWLNKDGAELSSEIRGDKEVQGRQREYKYDFNGVLKVEDVTTIKCNIEVGENG